MKKLIIGRIVITNPWEKLSKFKNLKKLGFTIENDDYFPKHPLKIKRLELKAHTQYTKQYLQILSNFKNLTEIKFENVKLTKILLKKLSEYTLRELHFFNCPEEFEVNEYIPSIFYRLEKLSTVNTTSVEPTKILSSYFKTYHINNTIPESNNIDLDSPNKIKTLNLSYFTFNPKYYQLFNFKALKTINIYVAMKAYKYSQNLLKFTTDIDPGKRVEVKLPYKSKKDILQELNTKVEIINKARKIIEEMDEFLTKHFD